MLDIFKKIKNPFYWLGSLIFSGLVFLINNNAFAAGVGETTGVELKNPLGTTSIIQVINNVLNYLIYISVPILAIMILVGGFQILTSRDNPEKIKSGKTTITYAVIGFVIVLISKGVALILLKIMG